MLILDIDYFKKINDSHGHIAGDFVIKSVAQQCVLSIRQEDLCARWGGEEFIIFLSESMLEDGIAVARRLRQDIEELSVAFESEQINVTVSIGVAVYNPEDKNVNQTIIRGDMALYQAKNSGRNRVVDENGVCYF